MKTLAVAKLSFVTVLLFAGSWAKGQERKGNGLGTEDIEIVKEYNPFISDAVKINFPATLPEPEAEKFELIYSSPSKLITIPFTPAPLKPLAIGKEKPQKYPQSFIKLGFGTQLSPLVELFYNDGKLEKYNYGGHFRHFSSRASKIKYQNFNNTSASVFGNYFFKKSAVKSEVSYNRNSVFYYGYDHSDTTFKKNDIKQRFNDLEWETKVNRTSFGKSGIDYDGIFNLSYYDGKYKISEFAIDGRGKVQKIFKDKHYVTLSIWEDYSIFKKDTFKLNRNFIGVKPVYEYSNMTGNIAQTWRVFGGVELLWEDKIFHVFPELGLEKPLYDKYIVYYNGWRMELQKGSYKSLTEENPWLGQNFELKSPWTEDRYLGVRGNPVKDFTYDIRFGQKVIRRLPLFINDPEDTTKFTVLYDNRTDILNLHAELFYRVNTSINFGLYGDYFNYEMGRDTISKPYHLPRWKLNFTAQYMIKEKATITLELYGRDAVYAKRYGQPDKKLKGTADINIGAIYKYSKYFSFFCNLNNLANIKHEKYYLYPSYGFNMIAGAIFTY